MLALMLTAKSRLALQASLDGLNSTAGIYRLQVEGDFVHGGFSLTVQDTGEVLVRHTADAASIEMYLRGYARGHRTASLG
jgi:hypothetical protein